MSKAAQIKALADVMTRVAGAKCDRELVMTLKIRSAS